MSRIEKAIVLWAIASMALYVPLFFASLRLLSHEEFLQLIPPLHILGILQNLLALLLAIRDLYKRPFPDENQKLTWLLVILLTGGIGLTVYVLKYAVRPRPGHTAQA